MQQELTQAAFLPEFIVRLSKSKHRLSKGKHNLARRLSFPDFGLSQGDAYTSTYWPRLCVYGMLAEQSPALHIPSMADMYTSGNNKLVTQSLLNNMYMAQTPTKQKSCAP